MTKRKPPVRHSVKGYTREGTHVGPYLRGHGKAPHRERTPRTVGAVGNKWTDERVLGVIAEARQAGRVAAEVKLQELMAAGPKWNVYGGPPGKEELAGTMLDLCGGAWLVIDTKQPFYRAASRLSSKEPGRSPHRFMCQRQYGGGGMLSIFDMTGRQELSVNEAAEKAAKKVLERHGVNVIRVHTYVD